MTTPDQDPTADLPGESDDRIAQVQERIDAARDSAGDALTDRAEETHPAPAPGDAAHT